MLDFINANFMMHANVNCYNKLNCFVDAMRSNQYLPISDEEIHRGVECEKAQAKAKTKILFMSFPDDIKKAMDAAIELKYAQSLQQLLYYNHIQKP